MIDLDRAEALLRGEGLETARFGVVLCATVGQIEADDIVRVGISVFNGRARVDPDEGEAFIGSLLHDEADALASALTRAAALCRRIETECRADEKGG